MIFKRLGNSDLVISAIGLGTGSGFGHLNNRRDNELIRLIEEAQDLGINFFDTAEIYFNGHSEELLGHAIHTRRDKVIIASKFSPNHSKKNAIIKALDGSLRRLNSDYVDLYNVHWPNLLVPLEETISTLEYKVKTGKIRFVGVSNFSLKRLKRTLKALNKIPLSSVENEYNFSERSAEAD